MVLKTQYDRSLLPLKVGPFVVALSWYEEGITVGEDRSATRRSTLAVAGRRRGFSLLELAVTLAIIGVMSTIAAATLREVALTNRETGGAQTLAGALRRARATYRKRCRPTVPFLQYARAMRRSVERPRVPDGAAATSSSVRRRAFSLFELLVVVAVAGVLTTLAANSVGDRVRGARGREDLAAVVRPFIEARGRAHSALRCARVDVDGNAHTVAYTVGTCGSIPATPTRTFSFPWLSFGTFAGGASSITFNTRGGLTTTSLAELVVTTAGGETARLRVYPAIGQVELVR
jgi:prepilin-type N-terminal cleavage/methylation domain-containing protein